MRHLRLRVVVGLAVALLLVASTAWAQRAKGGGGTTPGQWVIMTYVPDNNYSVPVALPVTKIKGNGVSFDFYATPDRAVLLYDMTEDRQLKPGKLIGRSLRARVAIDAPSGAQFIYFNNDGTGALQGGWADAGGFVRLYFQGVNPDLVGCEPGWHPGRPDCEAQYWWSNPLHIDLNDLAALGAKGVTLEALLSPENWSDRDGHMGDADANHLAWFNAAVANATKMGLSFGGNGWWAFGCGFDDTTTLSATFVLSQYLVK
jgi:hypothetical protein